MRPASDNAQIMRPAIANCFPTPGLEQQTWLLKSLLMGKKIM